MSIKEKNKSLLEIAVELFHEKHKLGIKKPQPIMQIAKEVMEIKGLKTTTGKELLPQFLADFMESGYFVYCGDGCWDLKENQPVSVLEKDISDSYVFDSDDEVAENELGDEYIDEGRSNEFAKQEVSEEDEEKDSDELADLFNYQGEDDDTPTEQTFEMFEDSEALAGEQDVEVGFEEDEGEEE